jgi:hypothetical protein
VGLLINCLEYEEYLKEEYKKTSKDSTEKNQKFCGEMRGRRDKNLH